MKVTYLLFPTLVTNEKLTNWTWILNIPNLKHNPLKVPIMYEDMIDISYVYNFV